MPIARAVRIVTEVAAVDRTFDYSITDATSQVGIGDRVRVNFHGRSVRGWVTAFVEEERELKPLVKWGGFGPPATMLELLEWCARRWVAPVARFYLAASPRRNIIQLPVAPGKVAVAENVLATAVSVEPGVTRLGPCVDPLGIILSAYQATREKEGSLLILVPNVGWAQRLAGRLSQRGLAVALGEREWDKMRATWPVIVGTRGEAFAPTSKLAGAVVIDADDESYRSEASPTYHAVDVVRQRALLDGAPLWLLSSLPSPTLLAGRSDCAVAEGEAASWPEVVVVDRRQSDPRDGVLSAETLEVARRALEGPEPVAVVVILQRLGTGRILACRKCGELARCATCDAPEEDSDSGTLRCSQGCGERETFCTSCGSTNLRRVRSGVTTLARDVGNLLHQEVTEVTATFVEGTPTHRVVVGTEAVFARLRRAGVVIFVDVDQYLLAPRERARRDAVYAVAKAGRLVGSRSEARGVVVLQTRRAGDAVISTVVAGNLEEIQVADVADAQLLESPPFGARAVISGDAAPAFVAALDRQKVRVSDTHDSFVVTATDVDALTLALGEVTRPAGRLRLAVE